MATTETASIDADGVFAGIKVIDCDTHWNEPPDLLTSRAPASMKDRLPPMAMGASVVTKDLQKVHDRISLGSFEEIDRAGYDPRARLDRMDAMGIHAQVVYPNGAGFAGTSFAGVDDPDLRLACIRIYNDALAELQEASGERILPQAVIPPWDRDQLLEETRRATEDLGLRGITLGDPRLWSVPGFTTEHWKPFWEYCDAERIPVNFHIGGTQGIDSFAAVWEEYGMEKQLALASTLFYLANWATLGNFLISGLFDTYPNLKVVSAESGIGWIPFCLEALEYQIDETAREECKHLQRRPREYFRDHVFACFWFEEYAPMHMIRDIGVNNVLFETDFPHPTCLWPNTRQRAAAALGHLGFEERKRVLQDNAAELYKIDLGA